MLDRVARNWDAHDDACASLPYFWAGRKNGTSSTALADIDECADCGTVFWNEGLVRASDGSLCGCCALGRGVRVRRVTDPENSPFFGHMIKPWTEEER